MEPAPPIRPGDAQWMEGSTIHRPPHVEAASVGSTASVAPLAAQNDDAVVFGESDPAAEAKTVIRRSGSDPVASPLTGSSSTPASVASVLLGTRLNHFLLEELIGGGGMGAVFRARDERLDRIVAIKVIPFVGEDQDLQRRFRNEAQNAAKLDHPYIARVFDVGQHEQWHYIVFEHVEGINLRDMVARDGVLSIDDAVYFTRQIAEAIEHANSRGIVHRDIKPSNVLVSVDGNVKVVDMGLARSQQIEMSGDLTASGVTLGTFDYISPEQARDPRDADVRSDIYSLGCTLYYLLTGFPPYPGGTMLQKLLSHGNAPPPDPRGLRPEVSDNLTAIIHKMLAKDPAARYPRAIDVVADLRELAIREGLVRAQSRGTLTIAPSDPLPEILSKHLPWILATMMVLGIAAWLQLSSVVSRDDFQLEPPSSALALRAPAPVETKGTSQANGDLVDDGNSTAINSKQSPVVSLDSSMTASSAGPSEKPIVAPEPDAAAQPPQFTDLAVSGAVPPITARVTQTAGPVAATPVTKIVIGDSTGEPAVKFVNSLGDALRFAEENKLNLIEIATPSLVSTPIKINRSGITIRSTVTGGTEVRFVSGETLSMQRITMLDLGTQDLTLENLHLGWVVRSSTLDGGCLISVANRNRLVRLANCSVTIENLAERDEVFVFEVANSAQITSEASAAPIAPGDSNASTTTAEPAPSTKAKSVPLVAIELENVAVRGEATLINLVDAAQLQFQWHNGLLALSRRMLEAAGANVSPALGGNQIQISLDQVTAWTSEGFARMRLGPSGAYPLMIDRNCRRSVFSQAAGSSHVEITGLESNITDASQLVQLRGEDNAYDFDLNREALLLVLGQWNEQRQTYRLADVLPPQNPSWMLDRSPQWVVRWTSAIPAVTASRLTVSDFLQDGTLYPGFDRGTLPAFPKRITNDAEI